MGKCHTRDILCLVLTVPGLSSSPCLPFYFNVLNLTTPASVSSVHLWAGDVYKRQGSHIGIVVEPMACLKVWKELTEFQG